MGLRQMGHCLKRALKGFSRLLLVLLLSWSLVGMGGLLWIDNSWVLVQDNDPGTTVNMAIFFNTQVDDGLCPDLDPDKDGQIPVKGGKLLRGNGDQDDNREAPFIITQRIGAAVLLLFNDALTNFSERRTTKSYLDFGHLKVMPVGDGSSSLRFLNLLPGLPVYCCG